MNVKVNYQLLWVCASDQRQKAPRSLWRKDEDSVALKVGQK